MRIEYYNIDLCPDVLRTKIPTALEKEFSRNLYSQVSTNYCKVTWCPAKYQFILEVFAKDGFLLDYTIFSKKDL